MISHEELNALVGTTPGTSEVFVAKVRNVTDRTEYINVLKSYAGWYMFVANQNLTNNKLEKTVVFYRPPSVPPSSALDIYGVAFFKFDNALYTDTKLLEENNLKLSVLPSGMTEIQLLPDPATIQPPKKASLIGTLSMISTIWSLVSAVSKLFKKKDTQ